MKPKSKRMKADPTGSMFISNRMERELLKLVKNYREAVERLIIASAYTKPMEEKGEIYIPPDATINTKFVKDNLPGIGEIEISTPGQKIIDKEIPAAYEHGMEYGDRQLQLWDQGIGLGIGPKDERMLEALKNECFGYIKDIPQATEKKILNIISTGVTTDDTFGNITRDIVRETDKIGINRATTIARTEIMRSVNTGIESRYQRAGHEKWEWLSALDKRTCDQCEANNGLIYPDQVQERPPHDTHPNCRCTLIISKRSLDAEKGIAPSKPEKRERPPKEKTPKAPKKKPPEPVTVNKPTPYGGEKLPQKRDLTGQKNDFISQHKDAKVETLNCYDKNGNLISSTTGDTRSAKVPHINLEDTHLIHNHPKGGGTNALSQNDVSATIERNAASMTCTDYKGNTMTINRPEGGWPKITKDDIDRAYNDAKTTLNKEGVINNLKQDVLSGRKTELQANEQMTRIQVNTALNNLGLNPVIRKGA